MTLRWVVGDLRTGAIARELDVDGTWDTFYDDADTLDASIPIEALTLGTHTSGYGRGRHGRGRYGRGVITTRERREWSSWKSDTATARSYLAVAWVDPKTRAERFLAGGIIWNRSIPAKSRTLKLNAVGIQSYWDHRLLIPALLDGQTIAEASVKYDAQQLALIAKRLLELAQSATGGDLPIDLPTDAALGGAGTSHTRTYNGFSLATIGDRLRELSEVIDGPEMQFHPYRDPENPDFIRWDTRLGVEPTMMVTQVGDPWRLDATVPDSPVNGIGWDDSGVDLLTDGYAGGQGDGQGRPIAVSSSAELIELGWPKLEGQVRASDGVSNFSTLQGHADALRASGSRPIETITIEANAEEFWRRCREARAGDFLSLRTKGEPALTDGWNDLRMLRLKGTGTTIAVETASREGRL